MSIVKRRNEVNVPRNVKVMVYGQAGMGKTTLALSAPKPVLFDFDNGVNRLNINHTESIGIVQFSNWHEVHDILTSQASELTEFDTIVVDTIGKMMDAIISQRCNGGQPRLNDWSYINNEFKWFTNAVVSLGKHVIFVAHRDTRVDADSTVFIPALREKSYNSIVTDLDLLGYVEMKNENGRQVRSITFDPTSRNDGKNTCQLPGMMYIPVILDTNGNKTGENDFLAKNVIARFNASVNAKLTQQAEFNKAKQEISEGVEQITDAQSANVFIKGIRDYAKHGNSIIIFARNIFSQKAKALGLVYNNETKEYENAKND